MAEVIYAKPDMTKKVRERDRGQRGDTEDSVEMEERVVDIYESADVVLGRQEDMRDNAAGRQAQGQRSKTERSPSLRVAAGCLVMLCLILLGVIIGQAVHYHSDINQLTMKADQLNTDPTNLTLERDQLKISYANLTREKDQLKISYANLTLERDQLKISYANLTREKDQLKISYANLTLERDQLNASYNNLTLENNWLKSEVQQLKAVKSCPDGWMKFGDRCYYRSTEKKTWEESRDECIKDGAYLVIINSEDEKDLIRRVSPGYEYTWIGGRRTWTWVDGSWNTEIQFSGWGNCIVYRWYDGGQWYNLRCSEAKPWICEK